MPTAVEYDPENQGSVAQTPGGKDPGPPQVSTSGPQLNMKNPGPPQTTRLGGGLFLGGLFLMIFAVLLIIVVFGPIGFVLGLFKPFLSAGEWGSLTCQSNQSIGDPGLQPSPAGDGPGSFPYQLLTTFSDVWVGLGGDSLMPLCTPVKSALQPASGKVDITQEPTHPVDEPTETGQPVSTESGPAGIPPDCTPNPNDNVCSACENTDLDSANCICNMDGVCGPGEGLNCGDCMPTASGPDGGKKKTPCPVGAVCP